MKTFISLLVAGVMLQAQSLDVAISPNPAPLGATIAITANSATSNVYTPFGCLVSAIRQGSPTGPVVRSFPCTYLGALIPQCGPGATPRTSQWNQTVTGGVATPGLYYAVISTTAGLYGPALPNQFYAITIAPTPTDPTLSLGAPATQGTLVPITLNAPANPFDVYILGLSGSTNVGILTGGAFVSLDFDALLPLSIDGSLPQVFQNFYGSLDGSGQANSVGLNIPSIPSLACTPLFLQGVILPSGSPTILTSNVVTFFVN